MNENNEFTRQDIVIYPDLSVDYDTGTISVYIESWFDVDKKFGTHVLESDDEWLNLYADYSPRTDNLSMVYQLDKNDYSEFFTYNPTESEAQLIKDMIDECCQKYHGCSAKEYAEDTDIIGEMGGMS